MYDVDYNTRSLGVFSVHLVHGVITEQQRKRIAGKPSEHIPEGKSGAIPSKEFSSRTSVMHNSV